MLNKYTVFYLVFSCAAALLGMIAAVAGRRAAGRIKGAKNAAVRHRLEQHLYLAFSALGLGLIAKLILAPVWFLLLQSLIPSLPGAMCLSGVHQAVAFFSWLSSSLKLLLPMLYGAWLLISLVDRQFVEQPYMRIRSGLLLPLAALAAVEMGSDLVYLLSLKPIKVSCCTQGLGDTGLPVPQLGMVDNVTLLSWGVGVLGLALVWWLWRVPKSRWGSLLCLLAGIALPALLVLSLHYRQTPVQLPSYFINTIYHHCVFCLLQSNLPAVFSLALIYLGGALTVALSLVYLSGGSLAQSGRLESVTVTFRRLAVFSLIVGLVVFCASWQ